MSSSNTQRAGKSTRDRGNKSPSSATAQSPKSANATDGHAKPPDGFNPKVQPTPEQIRLAQIINDPTKSDDPDIQKKVQQVMEVTGQSSDAVVIALHDCDNDPAGAIAMLIEGNKHEGEWETRGKKKKIRESAGQKGDGVTAPLSNKENRGMAPGRGGSAGPRARGSTGPQGGRGTSQRGSWRNKELEKNERNLEDGRPGDRGGDGRPPPRGIRRGGSRGGRGGGNVGGGPGRSSRTFQNRGYGGPSGPQEGFPQAMDTWTNNAGGHRDQRSSARGAGQHSDSMAVGNWNDLAASEDWSEEDWSGQLETKVFTASSSSGAPPAPPDTASIMQLLKEGPSSSAPPSQQQQAPTLSVAQFNQQATETIKAAVGVSGPFSSGGSPSLFGDLLVLGISRYKAVFEATCNTVLLYSAGIPAGPKPVAVPPRTKTPRVRVPPPSKIPESAVVMPDDAVVSSLDVQFGGLEFGTDTFDFGASDGMASAAAAAAAASHQPAPVQQDPTGGQGNAGTVPGPMGPVSGSVQGLGASQGVGGAGGSLHGKDSVGGTPSSLSMGPPVLSGSRPPGIPALGSTGAPKELNTFGRMCGSSDWLCSLPSAWQVGGVMGSEHLLLQSQGVSAERSKPVASSSAAGPQSKMYGQSAQRPSQGMDGGSVHGILGGASVSKGVGEQPMYSSAGGGHHYSSSSYQQPGGSKGGLVGSSPYATLAHSQQGFANSASSSAQQHYYSPQQSTATSAFGQQQQSNGYQGSFQGNAYSSGSSQQQQQQQGGYGVSSKLSGTSGLGSHSVKDSVLEAAQQQQQQQQHTYENSHGSVTGGGLPSGPASTLATTASSLAGATATTSVLKNSMSATGKTLPNLPPGVPAAMLSHQYLVGNAAMPFYSYYDMQFQVPTTSLTGRDLTLNNMAYAEAKFGRGESSESSPGGAAGVPGASQGQQHAGGVGAAGAGAAPGGSQQQQQAAGQPFLNALPPPYGYYFTGMPGSIHHYGPPPMFPVPPATNAHGPTTSAQFQKANAYASHTFASGGYEGLTQTPDYAKGAYGAGSQGQAKGIPGSLGSADASRSGHARTHPHLAKSFEKPGFLAVTAPAPPQQQPPPPSSSNPSSSSSYPAFVPPRASPPSMAKQHHQLRQAYPFWGN
ncbi:unnamed protein product [Ixodes pacificus]